jgi:ElaB/YqjD/DUF883 family membrane-anchored ribosome-binding protein
MNHLTEPTVPTPNPELAGDVAERLANKAEDAIQGGKRVVAASAQSLQSELDDLNDKVPAAVSRVAARAEDLTRRGIERARQTAAQARERATQVGDATVDRIKAEPVKAVLIAAAAGAATALLLQWLSHSRRGM